MAQHAIPAWGVPNRLAGVVQRCVYTQCGVARVVVQLGTGELIEASVDDPWTPPHLHAIRPPSEAPFQAGEPVEVVVMSPCIRVMKPTDGMPHIPTPRKQAGKTEAVPPRGCLGGY